MFIFGLFSTNVPYLVLMGLYLLGFGVYSSNTLREKLLSNKEEDSKTIVLSKTQKVQFDLKKTYYYHTNFEKNTSSLLSEDAPIADKYEKQRKKKNYPSKEDYFSLAFSFSQFSRPPPAQFI